VNGILVWLAESRATYVTPTEVNLSSLKYSRTELSGASGRLARSDQRERERERERERVKVSLNRGKSLYIEASVCDVRLDWS